MWLFILILIVVFLICVSSGSSSASKEIVQKKIALQNHVSTPHTELVMTDKELARVANSHMNKLRKDMERCLDSMQKVITPKSYFAKMNVYEELKTEIFALKRVWIGDFYVKLPSENDLSNLTNGLIDRYWVSCKEKSINAVSEKSKRNACQAFFDTMELYSIYLTKENLDRIEYHRSEYKNMFLQNTIEISR